MVLVYLVIALGAWLGLNLTVFLLLCVRSRRVPRKVRAKTEATLPQSPKTAEFAQP